MKYTKEYDEEDFLQLSGIQHFTFCRRQWALIYIEQIWSENLRTTEGHILHERAHDPDSSEMRNKVIISRSMPVFSRKLGTNGICDVVEFHRDSNGITLHNKEGLYVPLPIEYKRGSPKKEDADILQLVAQAICLEEMLSCTIDFGYIYYGETRHREKIVFSDEYRNKVINIFNEMHNYFEKGYTPKVKVSTSCNACSLKNDCIPKLCGNLSVKNYIQKMVNE